MLSRVVAAAEVVAAAAVGFWMLLPAAVEEGVAEDENSKVALSKKVDEGDVL